MLTPNSKRTNTQSLITRLHCGEQDAFDEFATYYGPRLVNLFRKGGLSEAYAEDLAVSCISDILIHKLGRFDPNRGNSLDAWVFSVSKNMMRDWLRRHNRHVEFEKNHIPEIEETLHEEEELDIDLSYALREAIDTLAPIEQQIIDLRYFDGQLTYKQIGIELNLETGTVRVRHMRICKKLAKILADHPVIEEFMRKK